MSQWKIFYTDGSSLAWDDAEIDGEPTNIPTAKRRGVHSVIQPFDQGRMRETLEADYYVYLNSTENWVSIKTDGLLDAIIEYLDDIECILMGRAQSSDDFWSIKNIVKRDTSIVGAVTGTREAHPRDQRSQDYNPLNWQDRDPEHLRHRSKRWES